ncbi:MAG TPA: RNA polymerase sigma factor SigJ [Acidimicrobiales bacterium]|nr:RNA polymerase sigma factor SigJ [Acidimicrobiales bacterium]
MDAEDALTSTFEGHRPHLRAVAYRMLGSSAEADDAVQEAWLRYRRTDTSDVANLGGWLTTVVSRVCLNLLRSRTTRREEPLDPHVPDPVVTPVAALDPEQEVVLADSVGLALLVVLEALSPAERVAFVLHDMFSVPFEDIAPVVDRTPEATRQLASRARRRVDGAAPVPEADPARRREVVDAFFAAARRGDLGALVAVLDPDVVLRSDGGVRAGSRVLRGADAVSRQAAMFGATDRVIRPVLVDGLAGVVVSIEGRPVAVMAFTVAGGRIVAIDALGDPDRVGRLALP